MKKQTKKEIGTREIKNDIEMVLKGHDHNGKELWVTAKYNDKPKMDERKKDKQATAFRIEGAKCLLSDVDRQRCPHRRVHRRSNCDA